MNTQMIIRIDPVIRNKINRLARSEGKTVSEVVRELLADYVRDRDIGGYIDGLWDRVGVRLRSHGLGPRDVRRAIKEVRARK